VRDAVLHHLDELELPFRSAARSAMRLHRFKLAWLAWLVLLPRLTLQALSVARHGRRGESWAPTSEHAATRRLVELTGKDTASAHEDVEWMVGQLGLLGYRPPNWPVPAHDPSERTITRAELEVVPDALIGLVLQDRHTDDPLLAATQDCYAAYEQVQREQVEHSVQRPPGWVSLRMERHLHETYEPRLTEASRRCRQAWIGWLDQQAAAKPS
jgi:hypothetical protein